MNTVRLPNKIYGKWIWKKSLTSLPDSVAMLRREFSCSYDGEEVTLWISAINTYQLFLNGRLIGFGPRAHHSIKSVFIDQHDLSDFVENGVNVLTVLVSYNVDSNHSNRPPGFWCQLASGDREILCSDERWLIRDGAEFAVNRPRVSPHGELTGVVRASKLPLEWQLPAFEVDNSWEHPDILNRVEQFGVTAELHPLPPPVISPEHPVFSPHDGGRVSAYPQYSEVYFSSASGNGDCFAATGYIFCERPNVCKVRVYADDPFRFFCAGKEIAAADWCAGESDFKLELRAGWNALVVYQTPRYNSMGVTLVFDGCKEKITVLQDMMQDAASGWLCMGPLQMSLGECTGSFRPDGLAMESCRTDAANTVSPADILREAELQPMPQLEAMFLRSGEYRIFKLDQLRYGFVRMGIAAGADDVVDIIAGVRRSANGFVQAVEGMRCCVTFHCRGGINKFCAPFPADCLYLAVAVRSAKGSVNITELQFDELVSASGSDTEEFRCSDDELNAFWSAGKNTLRRSAAFIPVSDAGVANDCSLLDAYIDSANVAAVFGNADYIAFRLRRFSARQFESGEIPPLTFSKRRGREISQMFFLPLWINFNYQFSGNRVEFDRAMSTLDRARVYFETMLDEETGVLTGLKKRFGITDVLLDGIDDDDISTEFNALFCRFMLSAADSYQLAENQTMMRHCRRVAARVAANLTKSNGDPETGLFCDRKMSSPEPEATLRANFYALLAGVMPLENFEKFFFSFFSFDPPYYTGGEESTYFEYLFMEMLFAIGQREWAMGYFREYWNSRLCRDANSWYVPGGNFPAPTRFTGGGSVSPNSFLLSEILGIRIATTAHSTVYFNPAFREVRFAEGTIPMAHGKLMVRWEIMEDGSLDVTLNSTVPIKVVPELSSARLAQTEFKLSDQVTLLKPPEEILEEDQGSFVSY